MAGDEGIGEFLPVLLGALGDLRRVADVLAEDDLHRALRPHDGDLGGRPGKIDVAAQMLRAHHVIGATIGLAGDHRHLWHGAFGVGIEQLGAVLDDAAEFLRRAGQEARHVDEGYHRYVEAIAEADEASRLG